MGLISRASLRRFIVTAGAALIAAFHVVILLRRIADGSITDPAVVARWIASAALLGLCLTLRRVVMRHLGRGRSLAALLLVVLLLHAPVGDAALALDERVAALGQIGLSLIAFSLAAVPVLAAIALRPAAVGHRAPARIYAQPSHYRPDPPRPPPSF